ncbi:hypothetical protein Theos_1697 [Thermus oshimai JL-2]|uniref:Uncharacterized protein n=1 Tax=Thermus oshimai JL-2 TaxID=751945 RepID=K7R0D0_THEOS|nr:hypothetical protein [Thermus oshimai]AFV76720.1 hypothetical protein Theos_1697 [Thermus oshimai JL-2]
MPRRRELYGTRKALVRKLWSALRRAGKLAQDPDPNVALKGIHALATITGSYLRALEEAEEKEPGMRPKPPRKPEINREVLALIVREIYGVELGGATPPMPPALEAPREGAVEPHPEGAEEPEP